MLILYLLNNLCVYEIFFANNNVKGSSVTVLLQLLDLLLTIKISLSGCE